MMGFKKFFRYFIEHLALELKLKLDEWKELQIKDYEEKMRRKNGKK